MSLEAGHFRRLSDAGDEPSESRHRSTLFHAGESHIECVGDAWPRPLRLTFNPMQQRNFSCKSHRRIDRSQILLSTQSWARLRVGLGFWHCAERVAECLGQCRLAGDLGQLHSQPAQPLETGAFLFLARRGARSSAGL